MSDLTGGMMPDEKTEAYFSQWVEREAVAERMIPLVGKLYREHGVVITVCDRSLVLGSPIDILAAHRYSRRILGSELSIHFGATIVEELNKLNLASSRIDIGKLAQRFQAQPEGTLLGDFIRSELSYIDVGKRRMREKPQDIVLYGFGRIGRMLTRILIERSGGGDKWRLRAVVVRRQYPGDLEKRGSLLRRDSVHGPFKGTIQLDEEENGLVINGNLMRILYAESPAQIDYTQYGIENAIVLDNSGAWDDRTGLEAHFEAKGVSKVILTAPGKGDIPNIIYGVNNADILPDERLFSAASCTTNAIVPVLKVIDDRFGIEHGHIDSCHSYTNDQNLIDNFHPKSRRGAVAKSLPQLEGKLTANAIRVPTPNVSLAILKLNLGQSTTTEEVNDYLQGISLDSPLQGQIDYTTSTEVVSSDFIGSLKTGIVDAPSTIVRGSHCVLYVWYDNEFGYSCQVVRIVQHIAGLELPSYPH
jgi:glyceraldehyde 3-phosphate dehydrogenase